MMINSEIHQARKDLFIARMIFVKRKLLSEMNFKKAIRLIKLLAEWESAKTRVDIIRCEQMLEGIRLIESISINSKE